MDAKNKLLIIMLFTSLLGLLFQTPLMQAVGGGQHRFINGNNVDCLSCHRNYPDAAHQVGLTGHQIAAENRNYTTYLEIGGTSYDPAGIIYTNIDSDFNGANDVWSWSGYMWIYGNQAKLYNLDFNDDGVVSGSETCKLCHNKELMRTSVEKSPEHTFGQRSCNDARCHGNSNEDYRFFKTGYNTIPPASISNPAIITGNFYINNTWTNPSDNDFNYTIFKYGNGSTLTTVNSSINYLNSTLSPHYVQNLSAETVDIYDNINKTGIWFNITLPNNPPLFGQIGNRNVTAGNIIQFNITAIDADNDNLTYGTNATKGIFDTVSGNYTWQTNSNDSGEYVWYFNAMDNYGGVATETVLIMVSSHSVYIPPIPANLRAIQGNFWINYTWEPGNGNITDSYNLSLNGNWSNGTLLTYHNDTVAPHGWSNITVWAYNNSGGMNSISQETQVLNNLPVLSPIGNRNVTAGSLLLINITAIDADNDTLIYGTNASKGILNSSTGEYSWTTNSSDVGTYTWYFNTSDNYGGIATETITVTVSAQPVFEYIPPVPVNLASTQGNSWIKYTWAPGTGNMTDSYNITVNGAPYNTSTPSRNDTVGPHGWSNITVYAYNNSGIGSLSSTSLSQNTQLSNNNPVQSSIGNRTITAGAILNFNVSASDADSDPITYGTNASKGILNRSTGEYSWSTSSSDVGSYTWYFNSSDNYDGIDNETLKLTVDPAPLPIPPTPINLASIQGNFWIEYTWEPGIGNITDSYNFSINGVPHTTTLPVRNDTIGPHGWSNITLRAYNNSGGLSQNSISRSIQVQNNDPVLASIGNKNVVEGSTLQFTISASDADSDPITYSTDARGNLNPNTGVYSWPTSAGDAGVYTWYFNSSDNYGGTGTETITVTVTEVPTYTPPPPTALSATQDNFWIKYTWEPGIGNITDSYNLTVNGLQYTTSLTSRNDSIGPHGWSNITVYAYNNSGSGRLSPTAVTRNTQKDNNAPVQDPIGSKSVNASEQLTFTVHAQDADSDIMTYSTSATNGSIDPSSGVYTWMTSASDIGTYEWSFSSSDGFGAVASETIFVTVQ
ncbi:hypothetical protein METP1_02484 [Methanosarcinales archaeon]|nr:hypothetical protein METP1_02484 [Methanosarcinales archaeon]